MTAARAVLAVVALVLGSCAPDGPRRLPAPELGDPAAPFRALATAGGEPETAAGAAQEGGFEARLRQRREAAAGAEPVTEAQQVLRLGSGLAGRLPEEGDDWSWAVDGDVVLALHAEAGGALDTLLFAQPFAATVERRPSAELDAFLLAVDPALASDWVGLGSDVAPVALPAARDLDLEPWQALRAARLLLTPTLGRGLAYRHEPGSFSGWRWIGRNRHGVFLRLGRTRGVWGGAGAAPAEVTRLLGRLASESPDLAPLLWREPLVLSEGTAAMVFGSASADTGAGAHLAVLCRLLPDCPTAEALGRFLDSLAPAGSEPLEGRAASGAIPFAALAEQAGIALQGDPRIDAALLAEQLRPPVTEGGEPPPTGQPRRE